MVTVCVTFGSEKSLTLADPTYLGQRQFSQQYMPLTVSTTKEMFKRIGTDVI